MYNVDNYLYIIILFLKVNGEEMCCWTDELLPILLDMLGDCGSQEKRGVALWVLGKLVEGLGYVIQPYEKYPTLLDTLLGFLKTEQQPLVRCISKSYQI